MNKLLLWISAILWFILVPLFYIAIGTILVVLFLKYVTWLLSIVIPIIGGLGL
jgi:hypothetical protein